MRRMYYKPEPITGKLFVLGQSAEQLNDEIQKEGYVIMHEGANNARTAPTIHKSSDIRNVKSKRYPDGKPFLVAIYSHRTSTGYYRITGFAYLAGNVFRPLDASEAYRKRLHEAGYYQYEYMSVHMQRHMYEK